MRQHEYYEMLISRHKDKDLNAEEILEMEKHLLNCSSCRKFKSDIDSISSILSGNKSITINKVKNNFYPYIISIAAILLIFVASIIILNKNFNNNVREEIIASNEPIVQDIDGDGYGDYVPLSAYFNDYSEEENTDNDEITILSSYMYYVGRDYKN